MEKEIYFDYSASTPVDEEVAKAMLPFLSDSYGNPSSIYAMGQRSLMAINEARKTIAQFLNCHQDEIFFTGSATEANNMVVLGTAFKKLRERKSLHIITSRIEHDAILEPCRKLEKDGVSVNFLPVGKDGVINPQSVAEQIREDTALVSIMYANNEIGTIQPIAEVAKIIKEKNEKRSQSNKILFHTDAVQAINYLDCDVNLLSVDMLTFSGHKIYGPKGVGVLYVKRGVNLQPILYGGGQERGLRPGTENVPGIVGIGKAIELVSLRKKDSEKIKKLRDRIIGEVLDKIPGAKLNGSLDSRLLNNVNFSFKGAEGESIVIALDQNKIFASTGSACSSKSLRPSHALKAIGLSDEEAHCSLRVTLGRNSKEEDVERLLGLLPEIVERLRRISNRI